MRTEITGQQFDEERALYHAQHTDIRECTFAGPRDGESALKEARDIGVYRSSFSLRYPLWHAEGFTVENCSMDESTRAALWYSQNGRITDSCLHGIKALRECRDVTLTGCGIVSSEFGWKSRGITLADSDITSEYLFLDARDVTLRNVRMKGKYSFQYVENLTVENCDLDTKDAFWHAKNVTVRNSTVRGEYLGWYSEGLTLIDCAIVGTQPLCCCSGLTLVNCTMEGADLAFEYSDVQADVRGHIVSVKNPRSGVITADSVGEVIRGDAVTECTGRVVLR